MYIRVLCTIIYQSDDLALSASDSMYIGIPSSGHHVGFAPSVFTGRRT